MSNNGMSPPAGGFQQGQQQFNPQQLQQQFNGLQNGGVAGMVNPQQILQRQQQQQQQQTQGGQLQQQGQQPFSFKAANGMQLPPLPPGVTPQVVQGLTKERIKSVLDRGQQLKSQGLTEETSSELAQLTNVMKLFSRVQEWNRQAALVAQQYQQGQTQAVSNGPQQSSTPAPVNLGAPTPASTSAPTPGPATSPTLTTNISTETVATTPAAPQQITPEQMANLKMQLHSYKLLNRGMPLPPHLQAAIAGSGITDPKILEELSDVSQKVVEAAIDVHQAAESRDAQIAEGKGKEVEKAEPTAFEEDNSPLPNALEFDKSSAIYPFNSYTHPLTFLKKPAPGVGNQLLPTQFQRTLLPSITPQGIDPYILMQERNAFIRNRIEWRMGELESLPGMIGEDGGMIDVPALLGEGPSRSNSIKIRALIEWKQLNLLEKQKGLREDVVRNLNNASALVGGGTDRSVFKRSKRTNLRDARATETLERKQRSEREKKVKQKQLDYVASIINHSRDLIRAGHTYKESQKRLGKNVLAFHINTEKEEAKRVERVAKERLRALKADDEEAYMKLIDTAKDTRITHLLRQTDSYLDSLAQAVVAQQNDAVHGGPVQQNFEVETGPADETMFGASKVAPEGGEEPSDGKVDYYAVAHKISEKITSQPSILVGGTLKEYQLKGLQWMVSLYNNRLNGILADEMGLGKTIQTLSLVTFLIEKKKVPGPYLIIVPLSTITNWTLEFEKWAPSVKVVIFKGSPNARRDQANQIRSGNFQVVVTTFEYIIREKAVLGKIKWVHTIIDEGHRMKNAESKLSQTLTLYYTSKHRLILTGTPLQNNLPELWALLNFVLPKIFNSVKSFDEWFNTPFANTGSTDKMEINEEEQLLIIRRLHKVLRPFLLRRLKKDVESELPDKVEKVIKCKMSALQSRIYNTYKKYGFLQSDGVDKSGKTNIVKGLNNTVMQLRKICNHPYVLEEVEREVNPTKMSDDNLWRVSGKFELLDRILPKLFATGHRVLIFFQMVNIMNIFEDYLLWRGHGGTFLRLDGSTKADDRTELIVKFNAKDSPHKLFILSTRAGGLGLNLQTADTVIIYDSDWNPHADLQAQDRAHRIGQKKVVKIFRLVTNKSIEEDILATAQGKLAIDGKVIQAGKFDNKSSAAEQEAYLRSLLEAEVDEVDPEDNGDMDDNEINELIARGDHEPPIFAQMDRDREADEMRAWLEQTGGRGKKPDRLMEDSEVPEVYKREVVIVDTVEKDEEGRGQRSRNQVHYDDGLTEEQFLAAVDDDGVDLNEVIEQRRAKAERRKNKKAVADSDEEEAAVETDEDDDDDPRRKKGKGKKRGRVSMSVTPSFNGDDDDRDIKRRKTGNSGGKVDVNAMFMPRMKEVMNTIYDELASKFNEEMNQPHCIAFLHPVSKADYPAYYVMIKKPIAMSQIKRKIGQGAYRTMTAFRDDFYQMFDNARLFNQEDSWVYNDANILQADLDGYWSQMVVGSGLPGAPEGNSSGSSSQQPVSQPKKVFLKFNNTGAGAAASASTSQVTSQAPSTVTPDDESDEASEMSASEEED